MSAQYLKLVVSALDLQDGDVIPFNQSTLTVQNVQQLNHGDRRGRRMVRVDSYGDSAVLYLHPDTMLNIERPDPQTERLERLCKVFYEASEGESGNLWEYSAPWHKDSMRSAMRAVLLELNKDTKEGKSS